jgi:hypothetical protein
MLELLLGNDVIIWSPETQQVDCAEDLFDVEDICLNGSSIQVTFNNIQAIVESMAYRQA